jgi:hypothetical protein
MKNWILPGVFAVLFFPLTLLAESKFDGTWKVDIGKHQASSKPIVFQLQNGTFKCDTCVPQYEVKADGQDHTLSGTPYLDMIAVRIVDDSHVELIQKKKGKTVGTITLAVSSNGNSLSIAFDDAADTNSDPVTGKEILTRVANGPAGSHAISGSWRLAKEESISDNGLVFTFEWQDDSVQLTTPTGQSYTAKLDGTEAPYRGDPGITSVSVKRIDQNTIEETDKRDGKAINIIRMTVSPDGKTMTLASNDLLRGRLSKDVAVKQ